MKDVYKPRPRSIVDEITPLQGRAWDLENQALRAKKAGDSWQARSLLSEAQGLRMQDTHERIQILFERSDIQSAILAVRLPRSELVFSYQGDRGDETGS